MKKSYKIGIVCSRFNQSITDELLDGCLARLKELNIVDDQISVFCVPGAVEIPYTAQQLALTKQYDAIICLGAVIYGETAHFTYVCQQVSDGCQTVTLKHNIPVIFGVLTVMTMQQAKQRTGGKKGHLGKESADAALQMIAVTEQIVQHETQ